jgi:hypothetical protein
MTSFKRLQIVLAVFLTAFAFLPLAAEAQLTNGTISGRIIDQQGGAVPGVVVRAVDVATGISHELVTDDAGLYRLAGLPIGRYKVSTSIAGFGPTESLIWVNVATNVALDIKLELARVGEVVDVKAGAPRVSSREEVVDLPRLEGLPLNGRQLADVAATLPGVGLGSHSDPAKSAQHTAQVNGGNGRNINTLMDGGDNNDDTVGGLLQLFPLEAIEQFNFLTQRFDAEYGRGGAVMNIVTKSGTNALRGSWFTLMRDDSLNAKTFSEKLGGVDKQPYKRYQYGGSLGGPIVQNKAHFFGAYERTQQDTKQVINTGNLLAGDGVYDVPFREDLLTAKVTAALSPKQYFAVRYGRDHNTQPSGAATNAAYSTWATSTNSYDSVNLNHNWVVGRSSLNEVVLQFSNYLNETPANTDLPAVTLASGAKWGSNANAPQSTEQRRWQFRDDYSFTMTGLGLSHEIRSGLNVMHTPRLFVSNRGGTQGIMGMSSNNLEGGVASVLLIGGSVSSNIPLDLYGLYVQDDWRVTNRLTLNLGVRYDYLDGMPIAQTSQNFLNMQAAGQTGRFDGTFLEGFGKTTRNDADNVQPRLGAALDLWGNGRDIIRGGWGIYTDLAYTNANALTASLEGSGIILQVGCPTPGAPYCGPQGLLKADGTLFHYSDPIDSLGIAYLTPTTGEAVSPRLEQPFSYQTNVGWSHELNASTSITADYVRVDGRDINQRVRPNVFVAPGVRYLSGITVTPVSTFKTAISEGESRYDAFIMAVRRRMSAGFDLNASYTLAKATSTVGTASDELTQNLIQNINDPFSAFQNGPSTRTDARHRVTLSAIVQAPYDIRIASIFSYRSALPATTLENIDLNSDGNNNDQTPIAYNYTGLDGNVATFEEAGTCKTVNCSRRAPFSQLNMRISRAFPLFGHSRIEAIAEVFNVFNAKNPVLPLSMPRLGATASGPVQLSTFMQPTAYAGDVGQSEQRIGQVGFRVTF